MAVTGSTMARRRRRGGVALAVLGLVASVMAVIPAAQAALVNPGTLGGFEAEGDQDVDTVGNIDWASIAPVPDVDDTTDTGFQGTSKENDPSLWSCSSGGASPGKGDLLRAYANPRISTTGAFLDLGFVRSAGNGDANIDFEFSQSAVADPCAPERARDDLLLAFDYPGGVGQPDVTAWFWDPDVSDDGQWVSAGTVDATNAAAASNAAAFTDLVVGGTIGVREFGEATLDLGDIFDDLLTCPGFGTMQVRSRSANSLSSALQDRIAPTPIDLSTCGDITIKKVDDLGHAMAGIDFGLYASEADANTHTDAIATCTTAGDGTCTFDELEPGSYYINEINLAGDYTADSDLPYHVDLGFRGHVNLTTTPFVNTRLLGAIDITKVVVDGEGDPVAVDPTLLDGVTFTLKDGATTVNRWTDPATPATCTISAGAGHCSIDRVPYGTYTIDETNPPAGTTVGAGPGSVVIGPNDIDVEVDYENPASPLNIAVDKSGPDTASVGDVVTYTFDVDLGDGQQALTSVSLAEVTDVANGFADRCDAATPLTGPTGDDGDSWLEAGETWRWSCGHEVLLSDATDADGTLLKNKATATGSDSLGRTATASDEHTVLILLPALEVTKTADAALVDAGDPIGFTVTVSNIDDGVAPAEGRANDVVVTDGLPAGLTWSVDPAVPGCSITEGTLTCNLGNLDAVDTEGAPQVTIHLTAPTTEADCAVYSNDAAVVASNADEEVTPTVTSRVLCPIAIEVDKSGLASAHVGDEVTYDIDVTNIGGEDLVTVTLADPICDDAPVLNDDGDGDTILAIGETWSYSCTHVVLASDPDPLPNTATATGVDDTGRETVGDDDHLIDVLHPAIVIDKSVDDASPSVGDTVTFSYLVTNTGDTTLFNVVVVDDVLGAIGTIDELAAGASKTLTFAVTVAEDTPSRNVGTATGHDELGKEVSDDDAQIITLVLGVKQVRPLPATGANLRVMLQLALLLMALGVALMMTSARVPRPKHATGRQTRR